MAMRDMINWRSALKTMGSTGLVSALPGAVFGFGGGQRPVVQEVANPGATAGAEPKYSIKFSVIGLDHNHINGITTAVQRGGGELTAVYSKNPKDVDEFQKR